MNYKQMGYSRFFERDVFGTTQQYTSSQLGTIFSDFEWDKGRGGIVNLGGSDNADGYILVKDAKGNNKIVIDNEGLKIYGTTIISINPSTNVSTEYTLHNP